MEALQTKSASEERAARVTIAAERIRRLGLTGLVTDEAGHWLATLAAAVPSNREIVEIGSYMGKSTAYLAAGSLAGGGASVWAVDAWDTPGNAAGRFHFDSPTIRDSFEDQLTGAGVRRQVVPLKGFSHEVARHWRGLIGLLFIDGSHTEADVRRDWEAWSPHLADVSAVVFDDYQTPRNPGVTRVVDELRGRYPEGWAHGVGSSWAIGPPPLATWFRTR